MRTRSAVLLLGLATALPRLAALLHERGAILASFTDKGDDFARTYLTTGTYGFIPGHPSAYTQPLYGWFLIPLYWIFGRHWEVVGIAHVVDHLPNRPERRHRHEVSLHETAGRLLGVLEIALHRGTIDRGDELKDRLPVGGIEPPPHVRPTVGLQTGDGAS